MENKSNDATPLRPEGDRVLDEFELGAYGCSGETLYTLHMLQTYTQTHAYMHTITHVQTLIAR